MNVTEVLDEINKLPPTEKRHLVETLLRDKEAEKDQPQTDEEKRAELYRRLREEGILTRLLTGDERPPELRDFKPIEVAGKPVSETIIEERG